MATSPLPSSDSQPPNLEQFHSWKLEDAKARLSEVVRLARDTEPQRITVRGQDAVVMLSAQTFAQLLPLLAEPNLHHLLSQSPLNRLDFEQPSVQAPVRPLDL